MFVCLDGLQGAGKTYYAVHHIHKNKDKYFKIYTNINEFNFEDNIYPLGKSFNNSNIFPFIVRAKEIYEEDDTTDQDIIDYLFSVGFLNTNIKSDIKPVLIIIDEAHNDFDSKNILLTWFITYHRHLFVDVILITQTFSLIHYSYHKLFEYFLHAIPSSRVMFGNKRFKYQKYMSANFRKDTLVDDIFIQKDEKVFAMYSSGDKVKTKSIIGKFLYITLFLGFLAILVFYFFINHFFFTEDNIENDTSIISKQINTSNISTYKEVFSYEKHQYILFNCINTTCSNKELKIILNIDDLKYLVNNTDSKFLSTIQYSSILGKVSILASQDFTNLFQGANNGKNTNKGFSLIN